MLCYKAFAIIAVSLLLLKALCKTRAPKITNNPSRHFNVIVYRATPAGIAAAIAAAQTSSSSSSRVLLLEPTAHVGGMATEGGIGLRDAFTNDFRYSNSSNMSSQYDWGRRNARHYGLDGVVWQRDNWVGEQSFMIMLEEARVELRLNTDFIEGRAGVDVEEAASATSDSSSISMHRIRALHLQDGSTVTADYFIDASYEGELMQATRVVDWTYGRESKSQYNEPLAGVGNVSAAQFPSATMNPFLPDGSLIKYIQLVDNNPNTHLGQADDNLMAYSFRVCLTKDPALRVPITAPPNYNPIDFEIARRLVRLELARNVSVSRPHLTMDYTGYGIGRNNDSFVKYDACCGQGAVGIDAVGLANGYATASRQERRALAAQHRYYVQGLLWFWRTDPIVPESLRQYHADYGLCGDEWMDNGHFPRQLYVREAARMVGDRVLVQQDHIPVCRNDSIAVGAWGLDQHDMQRVAFFNGTEWFVMNEGLRGDARQQGGVFPFEIPYWAILPKRRQVSNLAVVNCPSVSHVAFAAIRVEPTLWLLGQAAGAAAMLASTLDLRSFHNVDIGLLQRMLIKQGSKIHIHDEDGCDVQSTKA